MDGLTDGQGRLLWTPSGKPGVQKLEKGGVLGYPKTDGETYQWTERLMDRQTRVITNRSELTKNHGAGFLDILEIRKQIFRIKIT